MGQNGFVIDVRNIDLGERQRLEIGPFVFDITSDLPEPISIEPPAEGPQIYTVARGLRVEHFSDFGDFATRVNSLLRGGSNMRALTAAGRSTSTRRRSRRTTWRSVSRRRKRGQSALLLRTKETCPTSAS